MTITVDIEGAGRHNVALVRDAQVSIVYIDGGPHRVALNAQPSGRFEVTLDGHKYSACVVQRGEKALVHAFGRAWTITLNDPVRGASDQADAGDSCIAPMPGSVVEIKVAVGDVVSSGQVLMVIESMKMQMNLEAARDGVVGEINCAPGELFDRDAILVHLAPKEV